MKHFVLLIVVVVVQLALIADCRPLPGGQIVAYRVPNKFFGKNNATSTASHEGSSDLYSFLTQIHYGGASHTATVDTSAIQSEDVSRDDLSTTTSEYLTEVAYRAPHI
jgi:hypothetical protein